MVLCLFIYPISKLLVKQERLQGIVELNTDCQLPALYVYLTCAQYF